MSESARTLAYAGVAATSVILAGLYGWFTQPDRVEGFDQVGTQFYEDFTDPSEADSLRVVAFDEDTATIRKFEIAQKSPGQWVIPTHYDYPADARDRLNRTANSIIGIKRGAQKGKRETEHKDLGVLDPLSEDADLEGRGKRITLKKGDTILADYIIGNKVGDEGNMYYVRLPKQPEVFLAELNVDLSTKFGDWIESDLLKIDKNDLREIIVNKYSIDERRGTIGDQEVSVLTREKSFDPWKLEGLDEENEELKTTDVNDMVDALDNLKIVGVRPKPKGLNADLTVDPKLARNQMQLNAIVAELQGKGYFILQGEDNKPKLYANEGNVMAATEDGLVYTLNFGELFGGSTEEIEIGKDKKDGEADKDGEPSMDDENSRYLFVSVAFDEKYLGEKPIEPAKPKKPEGLIEEPAKDDDGGEKDEPAKASSNEAQPKSDGDCGLGQEEDSKQEDKKQEGEAGAPQKEDPAKPDNPQSADKDASPADPKTQGGTKKEGDSGPPKVEPESEEDKQKRLRAEWANREKEYETAVKEYETKLADFEEKVKDGKKKVDDLNYRLGAWYYVISGESFKTLRLARADLVKPKEKKENSKEAGPAPSQSPEPGSEQTDPPATESPKQADKPADAGESGSEEKKQDLPGEPKGAADKDAGAPEQKKPAETKESSDPRKDDAGAAKKPGGDDASGEGPGA